jgi:hypothetical protein
VNRVVVASDMMASVGYDSSTAVLEVEFRSGSVYEYLDVPRGHYDALLAAPSKGRYFNASLRGKFHHRRRPFVG